MSFLAGEWAEDHAPVVDTYERVILMKLARHAKDDGTAAYPYVSSLARAALCDEETVRRRLRSLQKRKLIAYGDQRLVDHYPASARPKVYDLLIPHEWFSP
ncbi:MAG: helix-turn-helix domain-containing protein, partial [Mycobacterium sp.]|nr:helix-turn-helix domain-containing protein [Mycobacterium sp.]